MEVLPGNARLRFGLTLKSQRACLVSGPHDLIDALLGSINCREHHGNTIARHQNGRLSIYLNPVKRSRPSRTWRRRQ